MTSSAWDRRSSERFARRIDDMIRRHRHRRRSTAEVRLDALVALTQRLAATPPGPKPTDEFRTGLRAVLLATAQREGLGAQANETVPLGALAARTPVSRPLPGAGTGRTRAAVLAGVTVGALALSGVSAASNDSLPGDPLYQVKRSSERAQLALAASEVSRGQLYLEFAHSRVLEAHQVGAALLPAVLADMDAETESGVRLLTGAAVQHKDATVLDALTPFVAHQRQRLNELHADLEVSGVEPMRRSVALLNQVEARTKALSHAIAKGCAIGKSDNLGPKPNPC